MNTAAALMPWILGIGVLGGLFGVVWWRRRARDAPAPQPQPVQSIPFDRDFGTPEQLAEAAVDAEQQGDVELAAELLRTAGMYMRAIELYRRLGNIQKVAELEILVTELQRLGAALPAAAENTGAGSRAQSLRPSAMVRSLIPPRAGASLAPPGRESLRPRAPGPSIEELELMVAASSTSDPNYLDTVYRLGLAHLANGNAEEARKAFRGVEQTSPGYRDAAAYLAELRSVRSEPPVGRMLAHGQADPARSDAPALRSSAAEEIAAPASRDHR